MQRMQGISPKDDITHNIGSDIARFALCNVCIDTLPYYKQFYSFISQYVVVKTETIEHVGFSLPGEYKSKNIQISPLHNSINQLSLPAKDGRC